MIISVCYYMKLKMAVLNVNFRVNLVKLLSFFKAGQAMSSKKVPSIVNEDLCKIKISQTLRLFILTVDYR